jgi:mediator of RNA polymerase II transcription subunit 7
MDDADAALAAEQEVKNPFPTPPAFWTRYTPENIRLLGLLKDKLAAQGLDGIQEDDEAVDQTALLQDEALLPSFSLLELEPPRLDWVLEQPEYSTFGETHPVWPISFPWLACN